MNSNSYIHGRKARKMIRKSEGYGVPTNEYACPSTSGSTAFHNRDFHENTGMYSNPYGYECTPNELSNNDAYFGTSDYASEGENQFYGGNEQSHLMSNTSLSTNEGKSPFPDLVLIYDPFKVFSGLKKVNYCLQECNYEPLSTQCIQMQRNYKVSVLHNGKILAEGEGSTSKLAEKVAGAKLLQTLRSTNYAIEPKFSYFPKRNLPRHVQIVDPKNSHIYRVVCLKKRGEIECFKLSGAVDYVDSEGELCQYIANHIRSTTFPDLYIVNVNPKKGRKMVFDVCQGKSSLVQKRLLGCSNKVIAVFGYKSIKEIFQELKACGGENIKYRLVPPGTELSTLQPKNSTRQEKDFRSLFDTTSAGDTLKSEEEREEMSGEEEIGMSDRAQMKKNGQGQREMNDIDLIGLGNEDEIEIPQWVADNLILMDFFKENNTFEDAHNTIRLSVLKCPAAEEFIVDHKFDRNTLLFTSEALIDKKLVGRARGFHKKNVKKAAAKNALQNLKKYCVYIKAKPSYFQEFPPVLNNPTGSNKIFSVVNPWKGMNDEDFGKILLKFKNSNYQDLFFCQNLTMLDKKLLMSMAKDMDFLVRCSSTRNSVCVYKKSYPNPIYRLLMQIGENEKYTLILPPKRSTNLTMVNNVRSFGSKESPQQSKIKNLFDYETQSVNPSQKVKVESNESDVTPHQTVTSKQNESDQDNYIKLESNKDPYWRKSDRQNEQRHSRTNKRSYYVGPGSDEERASSSSHHSYNNQETSESRQLFKEQKPLELNYMSRGGQDNSSFPRRTIEPVRDGSQEFNYQSREGQCNSSFPRRTIERLGEESREFNYRSREGQNKALMFSRRTINPGGEGSGEFNYQTKEGENKLLFSRRTIEPVGGGSQELNDQSREVQDKSFFRRRNIESKHTFEVMGPQEFHFPPKEIQKKSNELVVIDYNNMSRNQMHSNYGQYYQKEKRMDNDRHYNSQRMWSNEKKKQYDQRFH